MKRIFIFAALAAAALTACQQELNIDENKPDTPVVFTATTESSATKTALSQNGENYDVLWQDGDQITIVDAAANVGVYQTASTTTQGSFSHVSGTAAATPGYKAWYPASLYGDGTPTLPATQEYTAGNIKNSPMYAESSTESLSFKNICGVIRLNVSTTQSDKKVRRIILSADQGMSGAISNAATLASDDYVATVSGTAGVTLDCGESGVAISSTPTPFHVAVPEGTYTTLKITVTTTDGMIQTRTSTSGISVSRSQVTDITLGFGSLVATTGSATVSGGGMQEWVQLWAGGPKWAKFNVGSTITSYADVTAYTQPGVIGGYYSFCGRYDSVADASGTEDTATYIWGSNWQTPTQDQEQALIDNCLWEYMDGTEGHQYEAGCTLAGYKVSGKDAGFTDNSVFLPLAGIKDQNVYSIGRVGSRGCYWSSTTGGYGAYFLELVANSISIPSHNRPHGCSVRAICVGEE